MQMPRPETAKHLRKPRDLRTDRRAGHQKVQAAGVLRRKARLGNRFDPRFFDNVAKNVRHLPRPFRGPALVSGAICQPIGPAAASGVLTTGGQSGARTDRDLHPVPQMLKAMFNGPRGETCTIKGRPGRRARPCRKKGAAGPGKFDLQPKVFALL